MQSNTKKRKHSNCEKKHLFIDIVLKISTELITTIPEYQSKPWEQKKNIFNKKKTLLHFKTNN